MAAPVVPTVPDPRVKADAIPTVRADPDAFGAPQGRALAQLGEGVANAGDAAFKIAERERALNVATVVSDANNKISDGFRSAMWGENGFMLRQGQNAQSAPADLDKLGSSLYENASKGVTDPKALDALKRMYDRSFGAMKDTVAQHAAKEQVTFQNDTAKATFSGAIDDFVNANGDKRLEDLAYARGKEAILLQAGRNGDAAQVTQQKLTEFSSTLRVGTIARLVETNPEQAISYYNQHKKDINGADHIRVEKALEQPLKNQRLKSVFGAITGRSASAVRLAGAVAFAETSGGANIRTSSAGAAGVMQVVPDTARYMAKKLGDTSLDGLDDKAIQATLNTDHARAARYGIGYLQEQITKYRGDVEAALIAYNAGPANADKWLNAGRDYAALPKRSETEPYVAKVLNAYAGQGGVEVQTPGRRAVSAVGVDASLAKMLATGKQLSHVTSLTPQLKTGFAAMMADMPEPMKRHVSILSGYRNASYQAGIVSRRINSYVPGARAQWDADVAALGPEAAGQKWRPRLRAAGMTANIGMPGGSEHQGGNALDMGWKGQLLGDKKKRAIGAEEKAAVDWVHANAERYGLYFPMDHEAWHVQPKDGSGKPGTVGDAAPSANISPATIMALGGQMRVPTREPIDLDDWLNQADSVFEAGSPENTRLRAMLTGEAGRREKSDKADIKEATSAAIKEVLGGKDPTDLPAALWDRIDGQGQERLFKLGEYVRTKGEPKTDARTYYDVSRMSDEQFRDVDLNDYVDKLSRADFAKMADRQRDMRRDDESGKVANGGQRSRNEISDRILQSVGIDPKKDDASAQRAMLFERRLDEEIARAQGESKKALTGVEIQKLADRLIVENRGQSRGILETGFMGRDPNAGKLAFEIDGAGMKDFVAASTPSDIPADVKATFGRNFAKLNPSQTLDVERDLVPLYNQSVQAYYSGTVPFPRKTEQGAEFLAKLSQKLGRAPTPQEQGRYWNLYLSALLKP